MDREDILDSIYANVQNANLVKHMLAVEAVMRALARQMGEDEHVWGLTGLMHDIDVELTEGDMSAHGRMGADLSRELGATEEMAHAILTHNEQLGVPRESSLDKALFCADPVTGLITAAALVHPEKKLANVEVKSLERRFKEKAFAAGANREHIASCREIGMELTDFLAAGLKAMQGIADELGL